MKKSLIMALAASFAVSVAGTAFAAEIPNPFDIQFDGSITFQDRVQRDSNNGVGVADYTRTGLKTTFALNADKSITKNFDIYARATYQGYNNGANDNGFYRDTINDDYNGAIDAFGFKYKNAGYTYTIGSQALTLGGGLIYDNGYIGKHALPYAAKIDGKVGATNLTAVYAKTNYQDGKDNDKFYAIQGNYDVSSKTNIGAMYAHVSYGDFTSTPAIGDSANFYGVNGNFKFDNKWSGSAEYVKSNADKDNKGYTAGVSYKMDSKNTIGVSYFRVEDAANIVDGNLGGMTTAPFNNTKGYSVSWKNQLGKDVSLTVADFKYDKINDASDFGGANSDRQRFTTTLAVTF